MRALASAARVSGATNLLPNGLDTAKPTAARRLDPDRAEELPAQRAVPVPGISVWDYAMAGCFLVKY